MTHPRDLNRRRGPRALAVSFSAIAMLVAAGCSSSDSGADADAVDTTTQEPTGAGDESTPTDTGAPVEPAEPAGGSGPDGTYEVGDTYSDLDFDFTYEGLVTVPLDSQGEYTEGTCYFAIGSARFKEDSPTAEFSTSDAFSPSFDPIIAGSLDAAQNDEFFNCDASVVGAAGYTQTSTTNVPVGESAPVWLDAIYLSPDQDGQLEGFQLYGDETLRFSAEVTEDLTG